MIYLDRVISGSMAARVRRREALLMREIFSRSGEFPRASFLFDGALNEEPEISLEGGDFLVFSRNILIIGVSERTSPKAVDLIAERIVGAIQEPIHIFAVILPKEGDDPSRHDLYPHRSGLALVYEPYILGHEKVPVVRMDVFPDGSRKLSSVPDLFHGLSSLGFDLAPVLCGGSDPLSQQREQWISGANVFAFAPGKIIGYDCNEATFEALSRAGFTVRGADTFIEGRESVDDHERLVVGIAGIELARGGGGIRCMTMPLKREPL
jgi:arginine deiminase